MKNARSDYKAKLSFYFLVANMINLRILPKHLMRGVFYEGAMCGPISVFGSFYWGRVMSLHLYSSILIIRMVKEPTTVHCSISLEDVTTRRKLKSPVGCWSQ